MSDDTQTPATDPAEEAQFQAAEYALGLAEGADLRQAEARVRSEPAFAAMVAGWQERFVAMTDAIAPVKPSARVKRAVLAQLFPKQRVPLLDRLWVWKGLTLAAVFLAAYVSFPDLRPDPVTPAPVFATQLAGDSPLQVLAVVNTQEAQISLRRLAGAAPEGRVLQLWAILPEAAPVSLGVLPADETARVALPAQLQASAALITLAISEEPPGGAPQGAPTGAVLAVGALSAL